MKSSADSRGQRARRRCRTRATSTPSASKPSRRWSSVPSRRGAPARVQHLRPGAGRRSPPSRAPRARAPARAPCAMTRWCPRCSPSKTPIATTERRAEAGRRRRRARTIMALNLPASLGARRDAAPPRGARRRRGGAAPRRARRARRSRRPRRLERRAPARRCWPWRTRALVRRRRGSRAARSPTKLDGRAQHGASPARDRSPSCASVRASSTWKRPLDDAPQAGQVAQRAQRCGEVAQQHAHVGARPSTSTSKLQRRGLVVGRDARRRGS